MLFCTVNITSINIVGHKILEIRERALFNIVSKLENGIVLDRDLARNKELITKLFQWFLFDPCTQKHVVFSLLKHILKVTMYLQYELSLNCNRNIFILVRK